MNRWRVLLGAVLIAALALPGAVFAAEQGDDETKLPQSTAFHLDARWATIFDVGAGTWEQEKQADQRVDTVGAGGFLGNSMYGMNLGWLVDGHHDVGFHLLFGMNDTTTKYDPEAAGAATTKTRLIHTAYRAAFYYNYNWHPNTWVMPYLGPLVGVQGSVDRNINSGHRNNSTRQDFGFLPGLEVGVKLFPFQHVAFDLGVTGTYAFGRQRIDYDAAKNVDDKGAFGQLNVGAYAGLNVYFGKSNKPKPCPECQPCPACPPPPVVMTVPTTLTVVVTDKCTGTKLDSSVIVSGEGVNEKTLASPTGTVKTAWPAGTYKVTASAKGYDTKSAVALVYAEKDNVVEIGIYKHLVLKDTVYFAFNKDVILEKSHPVLDDVVQQIKALCEFTKITVEGHTDSVGTPEYNIRLSQRRAESVRAYLVSKGVDGAKLEAKGYGLTRPIASNDTDEGRATNRRVDFVIE